MLRANASSLPATQPATNEEYLRQVASTTEILMVKRLMLRDLPVIYRDAVAPQTDWNDVAAYRNFGKSEREREIAATLVHTHALAKPFTRTALRSLVERVTGVTP